MNPVEYIKHNYFDKINENIAIISDSEFETKKDFYKIETKEPVWKILNLASKYDFVFVILDKLNYDNICRLYKYNIKNICVINLNAWYTWMWKKLILPDLEDIYIWPHIGVYEIMDIASLDAYIYKFTKNPVFTHIRVPYKEIENEVWNQEVDIDYDKIVNFNQFGISWFTWTIISYGSMFQESINVAWLLQEDGLNMDLFWIWDYKLHFSSDLVESLQNHDRIFIIWDFDKSIYKDFIFSKFYEAWISEKEIIFITPKNIKPMLDEFLSDQVGMSSTKIYEMIKDNIN